VFANPFFSENSQMMFEMIKRDLKDKREGREEDTELRLALKNSPRSQPSDPKFSSSSTDAFIQFLLVF